MNLHFDINVLMQTFDVMWRGMVAIFAVLIVIYLLVLLMLKVFKKKPSEK